MAGQNESYVNKFALVTADEVVAAEHVFLAKRRGRNLRTGGVSRSEMKSARRKPADDRSSYLESGVFDTVGLALSGGGIRSAAFCTGVMQGLAKHNLFPRIDYLSTVSGGGYAGAAVSIAMTHNKGVFPFFDKDEKKDTPEMRTLRANANYLKAGNLWEMAKNGVIYLRGIAANMLIVAPVLLILAAVVLFANPDFADLSKPDVFGLQISDWTELGKEPAYFLLTTFAALLAAVVFLVWALGRPLSASSELAGKWLKVALTTLVILLIVGFYEVQPRLVAAMVGPNFETAAKAEIDRSVTLEVKQSVPVTNPPQFELRLKPTASADDKPKPEDPSIGLFASLLGWLKSLFAPLAALLAFLGPKVGQLLKTGENETGWTAVLKRYSGRIIQLLAAIALPVVLWYASLVLMSWGILANDPVHKAAAPYAIIWVADLLKTWFGSINAVAPFYLVLALAGMATWRWLYPNSNSPHRLYKERLGAAFCDIGTPAGQHQKLSELDTASTPFHIINTALNVRGSKTANSNGRNADIFIFSPLFCGSPSTGYAQVEDMERLLSNRRDSTIDMSTAVAVSGAAASANMGTQNIGWMSATLALLNVRLGYWMPNPRQLTGEPLKKRNLYFLDELLGRLDEESDRVYLTDGGHIENLGIYELLRRRCKLIIAADAEADRELNFTSFVDLQRYARIDLGARIEMKWDKIKACSTEVQQGKGDARKGPHCAIGKIEYDNGGTGTLIYIKSSVTGDENDYVRDYNRRYRDFPHEPTSDQFFNEEQFEVYRALGFHAADGLLDGTHLLQTKTGLESLLAKRPKGYGIKEARHMLGLS